MGNEKKKILLVMPLSTIEWGSLNTGGVDSVCQMLSEHLVCNPSCDYRYRIVAVDTLRKRVFTGKPIILSDTVELVWVPLGAKLVGKIPIPTLLYLIYKVRQQVLDFKPDVVNTHIWSWIVGFSRDIPSIVTLHSYKWIGRRKVSALNDFFYVNVLPRLIRAFGHKIVCVGENLKDAVTLDVKQNVSVIGNPIDKSYFIKNTRIKNTRPVKLVTCALLKPQKQIEKIILLTYLLNEEGLNAELTIIGPTSDKGYVNTLGMLVKSRKLTNKVKFLGRLTKFDIIEEYRNSDIGVFFSKEETFGLAPLEMIAAGLPLLSTEVGILAERKSFFENIGVSFVNVGNPNEMLETALKLISNPIAPTVEKLQEAFSVASVVKKYESLYQELSKKC